MFGSMQRARNRFFLLISFAPPLLAAVSSQFAQTLQFADRSLIAELESEGFIAKLYAGR